MEVSFNNLGLKFHINRIAFSIFGFDIYWYGVIIGLGIILAVFYSLKNCKEYNLTEEEVFDLAIYSILISIVGARLYYVIFNFENYKNDISSIIRIRDGGMAIYGGLIFGFITLLVYCKLKNKNFLSVLDIYAIPLFIGQCIGRWGNFVNQEAFGTNTNSLFSMYSQETKDYLFLNKNKLLEQGITVNPDIGVHPTFLYESIWCFLGIIFILIFKNTIKKYYGEMIAFYCIWYGVGRIFIESLRTDSLMIFNTYRVSQIVSVFMIIFGLYIFSNNRYFKKGVNEN